MADWLLILAPLLLLGVVLVLGFAGCSFDPREVGSLTFAARVPTGLTVLPPGVTFSFTRPNGVPGTADVGESTPDGSDNVFSFPVEFSEPITADEGSWTVSCSMAVSEGAQAADAVSDPFQFIWDLDLPNSVVVFGTEGSPTAPPFRVVAVAFVEA